MQYTLTIQGDSAEEILTFIGAHALIEDKLAAGHAEMAQEQAAQDVQPPIEAPVPAVEAPVPAPKTPPVKKPVTTKKAPEAPQIGYEETRKLGIRISTAGGAARLRDILARHGETSLKTITDYPAVYADFVALANEMGVSVDG